MWRGRERERGGEAKLKKKRTTGYHFNSSAVELRLINALLSVCCETLHEKRDGKKGN